ncbi:MAG: 4-(cytidine 5'-diphospho)-2-C-methyl-D-erythritol kinase [Desulfarculus sp.]|nr:4-(cytidine 5'-diphospho)-2-C-methyl-D-erythritol kinase [Desulfarculus sp.]
MEISIFAPAKVNLHLTVLGRRADGYHDLLTVMQPLDLGDELVVSDQGPGLALTCDDPALAGEDNLAQRAARAWFAAAGLVPAAHIRLIKRIPVAAGLGGGSSDAAAVLLALNALHGGALAPERLVELATGLGADVPFFLGGETALCGGVGERVRPWPEFPLLDYVLVNPGFAVSTAWAFHQMDLAWTKQGGRNKIKCLSGSTESRDWLLANDLEAVTLTAHPVLAEIKTVLRGAGAWGALMSGSGPTVFGLFGGPKQARRAADRLKNRSGWWVRACRGFRA